MQLEGNFRKRLDQFDITVSFQLNGQRLGVFGPSGSGKSTLLNVIAGLIRPDEGELMINGEWLFRTSPRIFIPPEKRRIALVFQQFSLFPHLSVKGNLEYGYKRAAPEDRRIDPTQVVDVLQLGGLLDRRIHNLSGGEKQRVALGRALLSNPRLLLMDEPLTALHDELKHQVMAYLNQAYDSFGVPFLLVSHSLLEMRLLTQEVLVMEQGRILGQTTPEHLAAQQMKTSPTGYINLLHLQFSRSINGLYAYQWGNRELLLSKPPGSAHPVFALSARDIMLLKGSPEAISARNFLECRVIRCDEQEARMNICLDHHGERLIADVTCEAARDLDVHPGGQVYAAIKASAFCEMI